MLEIELTCPHCGSAVYFVYDEESQSVRRDLVGCPGNRCTACYMLSVRDIDEERANEIAKKQFPGQDSR